MTRLEKLLMDTASYIEDWEKVAPAVSSASIGWHIEHIFLTVEKVIDNLEQSLPENFTNSVGLAKLLVMNLAYIPRGRARSPKAVRPGYFDKASLTNHLENTYSSVARLPSIRADQYFDHPIFGHMRKAQTIRFIEIHSNHHLKIIRDISKKK